ncbi:IclR family transcriptional regulator C-terminal domain-containing protein [Saliphagus infecundisoli]|uniref:IclR family transcriptional regulator C-terminal domain-containing protein n=1 Tax=Saliphagus infecundisoli TaxID=1849069 RepID=A0ABD5Q974_9EURY
MRDQLNSILSNREFEPFTEHIITDKETYREVIKTVQDQGYTINDEEESISVSGQAGVKKD